MSPSASDSTEREPLLAQQYSTAHTTTSSEATSKASSPFRTFRIATVFATGVGILTCCLAFPLILVVIAANPESSTLDISGWPGLQILPFLVGLLIVLPALVALDTATSSKARTHFVLMPMLLLLVAVLIVIGIPSHGQYHSRSLTQNILVSLAFPLLACLWSVQTGREVTTLKRTHRLGPVDSRQGRDGSRTIFNRQVAQRLLQRLVDTWLPTLVLVLLALSLSMDAYDTGLDIPGQRLSINLSDSEAHKLWSRLDLPAIQVPIEPLHIHIALEASPRRKKNDTGDDDLARSGIDSGALHSTRGDNKPTVIFFPPLDAPSGYSASHWLRTMVRRAEQEPNGNGTEDGHLALRRLVWFDRFGQGLSDPIRRHHSLAIEALALVEALQQLKLLDPAALTSSTKSNDSTPPEPREKRFILVSLHDGSLLAQVFAALVPELVDSQSLIDAETPESFFGTDVSAESGLRRGYGASKYATPLGRFWNGLLTTILSPLNPTKWADSLVRGRDSQDRLLGSRHVVDLGSPVTRLLLSGMSHSQAWQCRNPFVRRQVDDYGSDEGDEAESDEASLHLFCPSALSPLHTFTLYTSSLLSSKGLSSFDYASILHHPLFSTSRETMLRTRPTAVLSSFWKMGADPEEWGDRVQRLGLVKYALDGPVESTDPENRRSARTGYGGQQVPLALPSIDSTTADSDNIAEFFEPSRRTSLVGWWRLGSRSSPFVSSPPSSSGSGIMGDVGLPEGLCAHESNGLRWCEESVRKLLIDHDDVEGRD